MLLVHYNNNIKYISIYTVPVFQLQLEADFIMSSILDVCDAQKLTKNEIFDTLELV